MSVKVQGAGTLLAVGAGTPKTEERYTGDAFTTYHGKMIAVVRSTNETGEIRVTFHVDSLADKEIVVWSI